jgi:transcription antitermination protein NusB
VEFFIVTDMLNLNPDDEVEVEEIEHDPPVTERSIARRIALQVLYELDCTTHPVEQVIEMRLQAQEMDHKIARYVRLLVTGVLNNRDVIDKVIRRYAREWPLEQVALIDRNILRMSLFEFAVAQTTPVGAAIDEAVGLARVFGAESSMSFINGVLGKLADESETVRKMLSGESLDE